MATEGSKQHSSSMWCFGGGGAAVLRVCPAGVVVATRETVVGGSSAGAGVSQEGSCGQRQPTAQEQELNCGVNTEVQWWLCSHPH